MKLYTILKCIGVIVSALAGIKNMYAQESAAHTVYSPDRKLKVTLEIGREVKYSVQYKDIDIISPSLISISLSSGLALGKNGNVANTSTRTVNETISRLYGKSPTLSDSYNELTVNFSENYSLLVRAYDEGAAYRFRTSLGGGGGKCSL